MLGAEAIDRVQALTRAQEALAAATSEDALLDAAARQARVLAGAARALVRWSPPGEELRVACASDTSGTFRVQLEAPLHDAEGRVVGSLQVSEKVREDEPRGAPSGGSQFDDVDRALVEHLARLASAALAGRRLLAAAEVANRAKEEFLSLVSHELRTPLNAVLGWARLLRTGALDAAARTRAVETIERNALAQAQLIDDLLDISRIVSGKIRLEPSPLALAVPIEAALDAVRPTAAAKGVRLEVALERALPPVSGDPDRLQQVVWNLLANAIRFTPEGGRVEARLLRDGAEAVLVVKDSGEGIRPDVLPVVFDRFRRGRSSSDGKGLGLGLAIVQHLVQLHGGSVFADSEGQGHGATFTVRLPLLAAPPPPPSGPTPVVAIDHARLAGVSVLVVDDERDALDYARECLEQAGARVATARSAAEALVELERAVPHVLVSDIAMPGIDGYELMARVRALEATRGGQVPAVALTAYARPADRMRTLAAGFQLHAAKPVDPVELVSIVERLAPRA